MTTKNVHQPASKQGQQVAVSSNHDALQALWTLRGFSESVNGEDLAHIIAEAPDPETASRIITNRVKISSDALNKKWRKIINQTWLHQHPYVSHELDLRLTSQDVADIPALIDAKALLQELYRQPAVLVRDEDGEATLDPREIRRLASVMPSFDNESLVDVEHEWGCVPLRRMRAVLLANRLVRIYNGQLRVVESRYHRFNQLPLPQQFYCLWHADVYHVEWSDFAASWGKYISLVQNYLPLVWEVSVDVLDEEESTNVHDIAQAYWEVFRPLWQQEKGAMAMTGSRTFMEVYEQCALPSIAERLLIGDILVRYGIAELEDSSVDQLFSDRISPPNYIEGDLSWTKVGHVMLAAEREEELPCALDILG